MGHHQPFLLFSLFLLLSCIAIADDGATILKLANSVTPLPSGWSTTSHRGFCSWRGIKCDSSSRVTSISLSGLKLKGSLPSEISTLSELQSLALQNNHLSGDIPSLANLANLQEVFFDKNNFQSFPSGFFKGLTSLQTFDIGFNPDMRPWQLPTEIAECASLAELTAGGCNLFGSIPDVFGSLPSLQSLRLSYNNLTGGLPPSLAKSRLKNLWVNDQKIGLSGSIEVIGTMTQLSQVWLNKNLFTGPVPDLKNCEHIFDLQLRDNQLTGIVPETLVSLPNLLNVSLSNNKLQGAVPQFPKTVTNVENSGTNKYCAPAGVPCDPQVMTLLEIAGGFGYPSTLSDGWHDNDACCWPFITCDAGKKNVVGVNLANHRLSGSISPSFAKLTSLKSLYLSGNNLTGSIPDSLTKLPVLSIFDVSNNNLSGKIPALQDSVEFIIKPGNPFLGTDRDTDGGGGGNATGANGRSADMIAVIVVPVVVFIAVLALVVYKYKKRHNRYGYNEVPIELHSQSSGGDKGKNMFDSGSASLSIELLRQATDNFHEINIIGRGGFGVVYKGKLHDGTKIAVKRMKPTMVGTKGMGAFQGEIEVLSKVRHRNLVNLLGYCDDQNANERLLVYEFMPQGTLGQHLFECHDYGYTPLTWEQRITIALDVARGIEYMHSLAQQSFIHRDLKPANILLGGDMRAKVADFGLVRNAPDGKYSVETRVAGTFGYLAPEYVATGRVTTKVDVYAFGIILMEIITGRKALDESRPEEEAILVAWFSSILTSKEKIQNAIDDSLYPDDETLDSVCKVAELAGHCTLHDHHKRPDMGHAVNVLAPLVEQWSPASQQKEQILDIDHDTNLHEMLRRWQTEEGTASKRSYDTSFTQNQLSVSSKHGQLPTQFCPHNTWSSSSAHTVECTRPGKLYELRLLEKMML